MTIARIFTLLLSIAALTACALVRAEEVSVLPTETAVHTLEYGFNKLNIALITGRAHADNAGSIKVLQKIGMQFIKDEMIEGLPHKTFTMSNPG